MRAAIYARMSTDKQNEDSPADQIARCREHAARQGWHVVEDLVVEEPAVSGASRHNRPLFLSLFHRIEEWDALLAWDFSRLTRDTEDLGWIANRLAEQGKTAYDVLSGHDIFNIASQMTGLLNVFERKKIAENTRRGMFANFGKGLATGGVAYGYKIGPDKRIVIDPPAAAVVRRIFQLAAEGEGLRPIAHRLNAEGAPPPRPRANKSRPPSWAPSALQAMLQNRFYVGEVVYGRTRYTKKHSTGHRHSRDLPMKEWQTRDARELAIIDRAMFDHVEQLKRQRCGGKKGRALGHRTGRGRTLLSGFVACGACGGPFAEDHHKGTLECSWRRHRGPTVCTSALRVKTADAETRLLAAIERVVMTPENLAYAAQRTLEEIAAARAAQDPEKLQRELAALQAQRDRMLDAYEKGIGDQAELEARLKASLERKRELQRRLAEAEAVRRPDLESLRPAIEAAIRDVHGALAGDAGARRDALRALLGAERLRVYPDPEKGFRLEGAVTLRLEAPAPVRPGRGLDQVAGGRYVSVTPARIRCVAWPGGAKIAA